MAYSLNLVNVKQDKHVFRNDSKSSTKNSVFSGEDLFSVSHTVETIVRRVYPKFLLFVFRFKSLYSVEIQIRMIQEKQPWKETSLPPRIGFA